MVKSCGVADFAACEEYEVMSLALRSELHPARTLASTNAKVIPYARPQCLNFRLLMAGSSFPRLRGVAQAPADRPRAPAGTQVESRDNSARLPENPASWRRRACTRIR